MYVYEAPNFMYSNTVNVPFDAMRRKSPEPYQETANIVGKTAQQYSCKMDVNNNGSVFGLFREPIELGIAVHTCG